MVLEIIPTSPLTFPEPFSVKALHCNLLQWTCCLPLHILVLSAYICLMYFIAWITWGIYTSSPGMCFTGKCPCLPCTLKTYRSCQKLDIWLSHNDDHFPLNDCMAPRETVSFVSPRPSMFQGTCSLITCESKVPVVVNVVDPDLIKSWSWWNRYGNNIIFVFFFSPCKTSTARVSNAPGIVPKIIKCVVPGFQMPHPWDQETRKYLTGGEGQSGHCLNWLVDIV